VARCTHLPGLPPPAPPARPALPRAPAAGVPRRQGTRAAAGLPPRRAGARHCHRAGRDRTGHRAGRRRQVAGHQSRSPRMRAREPACGTAPQRSATHTTWPLPAARPGSRVDEVSQRGNRWRQMSTTTGTSFQELNQLDRPGFPGRRDRPGHPRLSPGGRDLGRLAGHVPVRLARVHVGHGGRLAAGGASLELRHRRRPPVSGSHPRGCSPDSPRRRPRAPPALLRSPRPTPQLAWPARPGPVHQQRKFPPSRWKFSLTLSGPVLSRAGVTSHHRHTKGIGGDQWPRQLVIQRSER
jgi:hypothetical protein